MPAFQQINMIKWIYSLDWWTDPNIFNWQWTLLNFFFQFLRDLPWLYLTRFFSFSMAFCLNRALFLFIILFLVHIFTLTYCLLYCLVFVLVSFPINRQQFGSGLLTAMQRSIQSDAVKHQNANCFQYVMIVKQKPIKNSKTLQLFYFFSIHDEPTIISFCQRSFSVNNKEVDKHPMEFMV